MDTAIIEAMSDDDPTAWLGDPLGMIATEHGTVIVSAPPARRDLVVLSLSHGRELETEHPVDAYVELGLNGARGLVDALSRAIAQVEEHAGD